MPRRVRPFRRAVAESQVSRIGLRDFAAAEDGGADIHVRTYDPIGDRFKYTPPGKAWVKEGHEVD